MSVTIKDVARQAGVSVATVSRVLNDKGPVSESTGRRIRKVVERLHYVPHGAARSLITNKTNAIGVLLPDIFGEFFSEVIRGIDLAARHRGYHLLVSSSHGDKSEIQAVLRATRGRVDGIVVMSPDVAAEAVRADLPDTLPIVMLNCKAPGAAFDTINIDNYGGAHAMVRHLAALGHRRIALIKGPARNYDARERLRGYRDALRALGLTTADRIEIEGDFTEDGGHRAAMRIIAMKPRPTAIFATNDGMAVGALSALHEAGVRVPTDMALAGFDDIPIARFITPPLTSVRVPIADLGSRAMERLLHAIELKNRHERRHETIATALVVRTSCGADLRAGNVSGPVNNGGAAEKARRSSAVTADRGASRAGRQPLEAGSRAEDVAVRTRGRGAQQRVTPATDLPVTGDPQGRWLCLDETLIDNSHHFERRQVP